MARRRPIDWRAFNTTSTYRLGVDVTARVGYAYLSTIRSLAELHTADNGIEIAVLKVFNGRKEGHHMNASRRDFFKISSAGAAASFFGFDLTPAYAQLQELKIARARETRSTCPYCAVGCGVLIYTIGDNAKNVTPQVIHVEGDPDHPTNRGTLCPKGASLHQDILNPRRLLKPEVRRPGSDHWEDISWDQALDEIAHRVKKTRDDTFVEKDAQGRTANRCEGFAWIGGCTDTNEFNYLVVKTMRSLGVTYIENQARV